MNYSFSIRGWGGEVWGSPKIENQLFHVATDDLISLRIVIVVILPLIYEFLKNCPHPRRSLYLPN